MSELLVRPVTIDEIRPHPNADRLEIAVIGGWQVIVGKDNHDVGDVMVHVPPDSMVPREWAERWGVAQYLSWKKNAGDGRVRAAKLRSVVSYGFLVENESGAELGADLADHYGITKYDPPQTLGAGQMRSEHPLFHRYTDIQNLRNFPDKLDLSQELVVTEKIHGTNSRVGWVKRTNVELLSLEVLDYTDEERFVAWRDATYELVVGTHRTQRDPEDCGIYGIPLEKRDALEAVFEWASLYARDDGGLQSVIVFGEIYGAGVQDLHYGAKAEKGYRVFDIAVNGKYLPWKLLDAICMTVGLETVPVLTGDLFTYDQLIALAEGNTELHDTHIREGIVVRPYEQELTWGKGERDPNPKRMIFKVVSDAYLLRKGGTEMH